MLLQVLLDAEESLSVLSQTNHSYTSISGIAIIEAVRQRKFGSLISNLHVLKLCQHCLISLCHGDTTLTQLT